MSFMELLPAVPFLALVIAGIGRMVFIRHTTDSLDVFRR